MSDETPDTPEAEAEEHKEKQKGKERGGEDRPPEPGGGKPTEAEKA